MNAANLFLLSGVILTPWVTAVLAEALSETTSGATQEVLLYALIVSYNAVCWFFLINVLARRPDLLKNPEDAAAFRLNRGPALIGLAFGVIGGLIGVLWSPIAATVMFLCLPIFFTVVSEGIEPKPEAGSKGGE